MNRALLVAVAALALAGCQTKQVSEMSYSEVENLAGEIVQRCIAQGVKPNTPEMTACGQHEANREVVSRQNARIRQQNAAAAASASLSNASQGYYNAAAAMRANMVNNRTVQCRSQPMGAGTVSTTCY